MGIYIHIQNRIPYKKTGKTPYELWKGYAPNIAYLKVWGCLVKILLPEPKKRKLGPKTFDAMFIGYAKNSATYKFLVTKSENNLVDVNTIIETKNVDFFENIFPMKLNGEQQVEKSLLNLLNLNLERVKEIGKKQTLEMVSTPS